MKDQEGPQQPIECICLFLGSGVTFTFRDIAILTDNETQITFLYMAMSDGLRKKATFGKRALAGVSTWTDFV